MDLSAPRATEAESDSGSESSQAAQPARRGGLSLVRPEILFGNSKPVSSSVEDRLENNRSSPEESSEAVIQPSPLSLLSSLSDLAPKGDGSVNAMANTMKVGHNCTTLKQFRRFLHHRTLSAKFSSCTG